MCGNVTVSVHKKKIQAIVYELFLLGITGVKFPVKPAEVIAHDARLLSAYLKAITAVQNFIVGSENGGFAFRMIFYKSLWHQDAFHHPISWPSVLLMCFAHLPLAKSLILAFLHPLIHSFNTSTLTTFLNVLLLPLSLRL